MCDEVTTAFHKKWYGPHQVGPGVEPMRLYWMGFVAQKCPMDLLVYAEIIYDCKPDIIIETGTAQGGTALFLANCCDALNKGEIITIDIKNESQDLPQHSRIKFLSGDSTSKEIINKLNDIRYGNIMAILDSDHNYNHVAKELNLYSNLVTLNQYLIVEDTNINGHPVAPDFGPGPYEAVQDFLALDERFVADKLREKFTLTFNPNGYLKKIL